MPRPSRRWSARPGSSRATSRSSARSSRPSPTSSGCSKAVKALRRAGFGFAVDDAGAGYASFALIAALRPTVIKIDRDIVAGIARDDAKQALVEAFVSFGRRIGAKLLAEGIEKRSDLAMVTALGVDLGQGYLLGRPAAEPAAPRNMEKLRLVAARRVARVAAGHALANRTRPSGRGAQAAD